MANNPEGPRPKEPGPSDIFSLPEFEDCPTEQVPQLVIDTILNQDRHGTLTAQQALGSPHVLRFEKGDSVYVLTYFEERAALATNQFGIYVVDISKTGRLMGIGISTLPLPVQDNEEGMPFVRDTFTEAEFTKRGLGLRRLLILNQANKLYFNQHLSANRVISPEAAVVWEKLVAAGLAEKTANRYRFIK